MDLLPEKFDKISLNTPEKEEECQHLSLQKIVSLGTPKVAAEISYLSPQRIVAAFLNNKSSSKGNSQSAEKKCAASSVLLGSSDVFFPSMEDSNESDNMSDDQGEESEEEENFIWSDDDHIDPKNTVESNLFDEVMQKLLYSDEYDNEVENIDMDICRDEVFELFNSDLYK